MDRQQNKYIERNADGTITLFDGKIISGCDELKRDFQIMLTTEATEWIKTYGDMLLPVEARSVLGISNNTYLTIRNKICGKIDGNAIKNRQKDYARHVRLNIIKEKKLAEGTKTLTEDSQNKKTEDKVCTPNIVRRTYYKQLKSREKLSLQEKMDSTHFKEDENNDSKILITPSESKGKAVSVCIKNCWCRIIKQCKTTPGKTCNHDLNEWRINNISRK